MIVSLFYFVNKKLIRKNVSVPISRKDVLLFLDAIPEYPDRRNSIEKEYPSLRTDINYIQQYC